MAEKSLPWIEVLAIGQVPENIVRKFTGTFKMQEDMCKVLNLKERKTA